jgi:hypothetical protein
VLDQFVKSPFLLHLLGEVRHLVRGLLRRVDEVSRGDLPRWKEALRRLGEMSVVVQCEEMVGAVEGVSRGDLYHRIEILVYMLQAVLRRLGVMRMVVQREMVKIERWS